jgi:hypothetical protein
MPCLMLTADLLLLPFLLSCTTGGSERERERLIAALDCVACSSLETGRVRHILNIGVQPTATLLVRAVAAVGIQSVKAGGQYKPP